MTVPQGDKVVVTFTNKVSTPHNFDIIPYTQPLPGHGLNPAFMGTSSPMPQFKPKPPALSKPQTVTFVADKAGAYMVVCGVAGHALAGMWDILVVLPTATAASITFK